MKSFWSKNKKSILALAPMAGVTDSAFRQICKSFGADVVYSEMASVTALSYSPKKTLEMLRFEKQERPYVVQLFGSKSEHFAKATKIITKEIKPDGIDINFGCPVKKVQKQGAGAVLMDNLKLAREIIKTTIENTGLPVSIKTRSKVGKTDVLEFLDFVSDLDIKALMIHGRTLGQGFSGPVDTKIIKKARDHFGGIILANGGINSYDDAVKILEQTQADGPGIARGAMGRPWIFKALRTGQDVKREFLPTKKIALKHAELAEKLKGKQGIIEMRKHLCWYVAGLPGARQMRNDLIRVETLEEIRRIFK